MNVVLICLDTFRADCVAAAGRNDFIRTPNIDRLIGEGVFFENAFGEGQPTIQFRRALCTGMNSFPFRGDYDTKGFWPTSAGWHKIPPEQPTMAEILLENGYCTGLVSDTFHLFKPTANFTRGFASWDFVRGQESDNWRTGPMSAIDPYKYCPPGKEPGAGLIQYLLNNQGRQCEEDHLAGQVFTRAIQWLDDNAANRPFFLWIDSFDPHEAWDPPRRYADMYDPDWDEDWEPIAYLNDYSDEKINRRHAALYYGECTYVDAQIGRFLDALEAKGLADDTLVVVTSDHGTEMMDHGSFQKNTHKNRYRFNCEIIGAMRFPGREFAGRHVGGFIQNQDFMPSLLGRLGVDCPAVDGLDFMPMVRGETDAIRDYAIGGWAGFNSPSRAFVRTHRYAYSCDYQRDDLDEHLFDLVDDPQESVNVAGKRGDVVAEHRAQLERYLGETLPGRPDPRLTVAAPPMKVWWENAPWARRFENSAGSGG